MVCGEASFAQAFKVPVFLIDQEEGIPPRRKSGREVEIGMCMGFVGTGLLE